MFKYLQLHQARGLDQASRVSMDHPKGRCVQLGHVSTIVCDDLPTREALGVSQEDDGSLLLHGSAHAVGDNIHVVLAWNCTTAVGCAYGVRNHPWVDTGRLDHSVGIHTVTVVVDHSAIDDGHHAQQDMELRIRRALAWVADDNRGGEGVEDGYMNDCVVAVSAEVPHT